PFLYAQLAQEVLDQHEVMQRLADWFDSQKAKSAFQFGSALGGAEPGSVIAATIAPWLGTGRCADLVLGYLRAIAARQGALPSEWRQQLDQTAKHHAEYAARLTLDADFSREGFERVMQLVASGALKSSYLKGFASLNWEATLGVMDEE